VALTVRDLEASVPWYTELFEAEPVLDEDTGPFRHVVWMVSGKLVGPHQFPDADVTTPFSERRVGRRRPGRAGLLEKRLIDGRIRRLRWC
jgi:glyoxylase I family protein